MQPCNNSELALGTFVAISHTRGGETRKLAVFVRTVHSYSRRNVVKQLGLSALPAGTMAFPTRESNQHPQCLQAQAPALV